MPWHSHSCQIHPNWVDLSEALYNSTRFARCQSALPEVKIHEIMIHEPSSFLSVATNFSWFIWGTLRLHSMSTNWLLASQINNRGNDLCRFDLLIRSNRVKSSLVQISYKSTSGRGNDSCRFDQIDLNRQHFQHTLKAQISYIFKVSCKSTSGMSNQQQKGFNMSTS